MKLTSSTTAIVFLCVLTSTLGVAACAEPSTDSDEPEANASDALNDKSRTKKIPNEHPFKNEGGHAATFSTLGDGTLDLTNQFHVTQGTNGRSCGTCHHANAGWSISPAQVEATFQATDGIDPLFLAADANQPNANLSTREGRYAAFNMLRKGLFRRGGPPPATREFDIVRAEDPYGWGSATPQRFNMFRRPLATANFHMAKNIHWDDQFTRLGQTVPQALAAQVMANIKNGQAGATPTAATVDAIVGYESSLSFAQLIVPGAGRLDECGARGGPRNHATQARVVGRFDIFDAWAEGVASPECASAMRASIARGQALFNTKRNARGGTCNGCHSAQNDGSNVNGSLFDVGASQERWASIDGLPVYTVRNRATGVEIRTTDPGKANQTGTWSDMNRFKVPSLRGVAARAPYFHNGIAKSLHDVVGVYEATLGFDFSAEEENDLVAFLNAL
jgi:cytochrome c peroxidase